MGKGRLICTSSKVQSELVDRFGIDSGGTVVLENGIELMPLINRSRKPENAPLKFITVGRLDYQKGLDILLNAWADSTAASDGHILQIVGGETPGNLNAKSKSYSEELNRIVFDAGLTECVEFLGFRDDITDLLIDADVYIHTARWEGFPLAVLEGMAASLPVIMTDVEANPIGFVNGVSGFVVESESTLEVARAIDQMISNGVDFRMRAGQHCRAIVEEKYDIEVIQRRFVRIIEQSLEQKMPR